MNKKLIIGFLLIVIVLVSGCIEKETITTETGPETPCSSDDDCWCRSFTGTEFIEGKGPGTCCTQDYKDRISSDCELNYCLRCFYE